MANCEAEIKVGDVGTAIRITILDENDNVVDISGSTTKTFIFKKPDDTIEEKTPSYVTDGTDGQLQYISEEDFFDLDGHWEYQAYIEFSGGDFHTNIKEFYVGENLQ